MKAVLFILLNLIVFASVIRAEFDNEIKLNEQAINGSQGDWERRLEEILQNELEAESLLEKNNFSSKFLNTESINDPFFIGSRMSKAGYKMKHPVVIIPGLMSTGLEVWNAGPKMLECAQKYFRQGIFGNLNNFRMLLFAKACWVEHMMLNVTTGLDRDDTKLRSSKGLPSGEFLFPKYWSYARLYASLAAIGYDGNSIYFAPYDWRLDPEKLEQRDQFFSRLKYRIEMLRSQYNEKIVLLSHSMGGLHFFWFMKYMQHEYGVEGVHWLDHHIAHWVAIAAPYLGSPTAATMLLSGEHQLSSPNNIVANRIMETLLTLKERQIVARTWSSVSLLLPRGGNEIWGNECGAADGSPFNKHTLGYMLSIKHQNGTESNLTVERMLPFLAQVGGPRVADIINNSVDFRFLRSAEELDSNSVDRKTWTSPLSSALPPLKHMRIFAMYGVNNPTERKAYYKETDTPMYLLNSRIASKYPTVRLQRRANATSWSDALRKFFAKFKFWGHRDPKFMTRDFSIDTSETNATLGLYKGFVSSDGDDTVPLVSLGYVPRNVWRFDKAHNPSGIKIITREYFNRGWNKSSAMQGPEDSSHVGILSNYRVILDVIRVVSGHEDRCNYRSNGDISTVYPPKPLSYAIERPERIHFLPFSKRSCLTSVIYSSIDRLRVRELDC